MRALPDRALLEHGEHLLELSCHFGLNRVQLPKDHVCRYECSDLKSHLVMVVVNKVRLRNLSGPPYLPSSAGATDLRVYCGQFLAQISRFPHLLKTWPLLLAQVRVDRVQPFVEVV